MGGGIQIDVFRGVAVTPSNYALFHAHVARLLSGKAKAKGTGKRPRTPTYAEFLAQLLAHVNDHGSAKLALKSLFVTQKRYFGTPGEMVCVFGERLGEFWCTNTTELGAVPCPPTSPALVAHATKLGVALTDLCIFVRVWHDVL